MSEEQQMIKATAELQKAKQFSEALLLEYQAALMQYNWVAAEAARIRCVAAYEAMIDQFAVVYRLLQKA